ncbi:MAG: FixH family protein [Flavobacteriaceae bacterium]|nr:FixH family protein [Flavobacteriaceae bacterium]
MIKINWGTAIVIAFVLFISFILYFVVRASADSSLNHEMVIDDYYGQELHFNDEYDAQNLGNLFLDKFQITPQDHGLNISIDPSIQGDIYDFEVSFYRPSNKKLDFTQVIGNNPANVLIPRSKLVDGKWQLDLRWRSKGKVHLIKKTIQL